MIDSGQDSPPPLASVSSSMAQENAPSGKRPRHRPPFWCHWFGEDIGLKVLVGLSEGVGIPLCKLLYHCTGLQGAEPLANWEQMLFLVHRHRGDFRDAGIPQLNGTKSGFRPEGGREGRVGRTWRWTPGNSGGKRFRDQNVFGLQELPDFS